MVFNHDKNTGPAHVFVPNACLYEFMVSVWVLQTLWDLIFQELVLQIQIQTSAKWGVFVQNVENFGRMIFAHLKLGVFQW